MDAPWIWLIPLLPLAGAAANGLLHARFLGAGGGAAPERRASWLGVGSVALSFGVCLAAFLRLLALDPEQRVLRASLAPWISAGQIDVAWSLAIDPLNAAMMLVVTGVGALIHLYSTGYMHGDRGFAKYFAYLNLFVAMMLMLILSDSLVGLFLGWEGVGLCSYLLIGFWYDDGEKADAARKAFVVNRIGDLGFLIGMGLLFWQTGSFSFEAVNDAARSGGIPSGLATVAGLMLFLGCCGKSAQIPLYVWLPDAMAGPTPVSALIHAATMVTSGIYLVARLADFFTFAPGVLPVIGAVGAATALFAATIGLAQRDIKKVLAYSTVSQLGYMFLALGVGAFGAALYHLITHAFFKALLFLGAGSVIHAMHHEQDMFRMGGLRDRIPVTFRTMTVGAFALAGVPLFSGFFSKDEILFLSAASGGGGWLLWAVGLTGAVLTAAYTGRLLALTFFGGPRYDTRKLTPHESPASMLTPLRVLAFLSVAGGLLGLPFHLFTPLHDWLHPVLGGAEAAARGEAQASAALEAVLMLLGGGAAVASLYLGWKRFVQDPGEGLLDPRRGALRHPAAAWHVDAFYTAFVVVPLKLFAAVCAAFDLLVVDGAVNFLAWRSRESAEGVRSLQSGGAPEYALWMAAGAVVLVAGLVFGAL